MIDKKPEVLAPAGDRERLEAALRFGADAVYLGGKLFNMRAGTRSFTQEELAEAVKLTHQMGKRLYLTCNTLLNNEEADLLPKYLAEVHEMGVDAAIVSDIGVLMAAHRAVPELCEIMDFSETNVYSTLHVCWGAQAGLYYHYGVHKQLLPEKMFGVFEHRVTRPSNPLVRGFDEVFYAPHSRHTGISREDVDNCKALRILAESDAAGPFLMSTENGRQIFVTGHPEYDKYTLDSEYRRDVDKGLPIHVPVNYYPDDDPSKPPLFRWRAHAHLLYENWLNYYVYQNTPYDLGEIQRVKHE